jgi:hypothetical protein
MKWSLSPRLHQRDSIPDLIDRFLLDIEPFRYRFGGESNTVDGL